MSVKLRFKRMGRSHVAFFRLNAVDSRSPRDGRVIEELGVLRPGQQGQRGSSLWSNLDRCKYWLDNGAVPSETVSCMLKKAGVEHKQLRLPKPGKPKARRPRARRRRKAQQRRGRTGSAGMRLDHLRIINREKPMALRIDILTLFPEMFATRAGNEHSQAGGGKGTGRVPSDEHSRFRHGRA